MITFKTTLSNIKSDVPKGQFIVQFFLAYFFNPGFRVLLNHRLGKFFYFSKNPILKLIALRYKQKLVVKRSCDISYKCQIEKGVKFPHPLGIVIGEGVVIKDDVKIWQQVTLGSHGKIGQGLNYPVIESGVKIFSGAKVIGGIKVGSYSIIGANSVVLQDIPSNSVAVGAPAKIIKTNDK